MTAKSLLVTIVTLSTLLWVSCKNDSPSPTGAEKDSTAIPVPSDLKLEGGYPTKETIEKAYDELDYQRAVQTYIWATPAVEMEVLTEGLSNGLGLSSPNSVGIFEHFLDANTILATGNGQSIYSFNNIDLSRTGPVILEIPPAILGFIMTLWQQPLSDLGPLGPDKAKGGKYLLVPPDYKDPVPTGYFVVRSDTYLINWIVRGFVKEGKTEPAIRSIHSMRIYRLADKANPPEMNFSDLSGKKAVLIPLGDNLNGLGYFEKLNRAIQREPIRIQDKQFLGMLATLGIEKGKPFNPDERTKRILTRAAETGAILTATISFDNRYPKKLRWPGYSNWEELLLTEHPNFVNPNYEELDSRAALYYQAAGASNSIFLDVIGAGSKYAGAFRDKDGNWLQGAGNYKLTIPANPPVKDFWSVTVYDAETRSMIANDQKLSGRDSYQNLKKNPDNSIDLYFAPTAPPGNESNWVQTIPGKGFFLYFRWYGPLQPYFDKSWKLPDVERSGNR